MARHNDPPTAKRPHADCTGTSSIDDEPPPAKRPREDCTGTSSTSIHSFHPDLLREIFLHLDSLSDLVRAACTCQEWQAAVASSPPFRRQFIKQHPAPLLGHFFDPPSPDVPAIPAFAPARGANPMLVTALMRGDFLLPNLQMRPRGVEPSWSVLDARGGYLLLLNRDDEESMGWLALLNPLARSHPRFFDVDDIRIFDEDDNNGHRRILHGGVISYDEDPERVDIFCLASQGEFGLRAAICFSAQREFDADWFLSSWLEVPPDPHLDPEIHGGPWPLLEKDMRAGSFIYWPYLNREYMVVLDPTAPNIPRLSVEMIHFPPGMNPGEFGSYIIGETHGGKMSIAYTDGVNIVLMVRGEDGRDAGTWTKVNEIDLTDDPFYLLGQFPEDGLDLVAMRGGILYFTTSQMYHPSQNPCWFGSLCLETAEGEWLFARAYDAFFQPYHHLSWTSFLSRQLQNTEG